MASSAGDTKSISDSESERRDGGVASTREILSQMSLSSMTSHDECFRSARHAEMSLSKIESYFLKEQLTDVVLIAGTRRIPAHRLVLSSVSEYFAAMFTTNLRESTQSEIVLQDVDGDALWTLVHYCYTGKIELLEDTVETLLGTACLLQLTEVMHACCSFLKKQLHPSNCIGIRLFADSQGCVDLLNISQSYTAEHFLEVIRNQEYLMLSADEVAKLLASDDLNVNSEEIIFNAMVSWVEHDLINRTPHISKLLSLVKLPLLAPAFIVDNMESRPLFTENPECRELMMEAFIYHLLPERRSMLQSLRTCPRKSTVGSLYAVGGMDGNKGAVGIEKYDRRCDQWTHVANLNARRLQFGVAVIDGKLFVVGGRDGLKTLNTVECFDVNSKTWSTLPPMSTHRHGLGVGVLEGPLYAVGGHDGWSYLNTVERYDPSTRTWNYVASMASQRSTAGVAVLNGHLYAVGGRDGGSCLKTVECYDPHTNKWTPCAPMAKRRGAVGVGVANGYLYAIGGHDAPGLNPAAPRFDCVERYDPQTDTWTMVASMSTGRDSVGVCLLGDRLYAAAGYDGNFYLSLVEAYDPQTNEWHPVASLNGERAGAGLVAIKHS